MVVTAGEDSEEGRKTLQISPVIFFPAARESNVNPRAATFLALPEPFPAVSWIFRDYYVIFYLCDVM
jgi:hypothetical protein